MDSTYIISGSCSQGVKRRKLSCRISSRGLDPAFLVVFFLFFFFFLFKLRYQFMKEITDTYITLIRYT